MWPTYLCWPHPPAPTYCVGPTHLPVFLLVLDLAGKGLPDKEAAIGGASGHILAVRTAKGGGGGGEEAGEEEEAGRGGGYKVEESNLEPQENCSVLKSSASLASCLDPISPPPQT